MLETTVFSVLEQLWIHDTPIDIILTASLGNIRHFGLSCTNISSLQTNNLRSLIWIDIWRSNIRDIDFNSCNFLMEVFGADDDDRRTLTAPGVKRTSW